MTADIINLRREKRKRDRAAKEVQAAANRARFGRNKGEKTRDALTSAAQTRQLDGHKLESAASPPSSITPPRLFDVADSPLSPQDET